MAHNTGVQAEEQSTRNLRPAQLGTEKSLLLT